MPAFLKAVCSVAAGTLVLAGQQLVQHLDDRDAGAQAREHGGELAADHAAADDGQALGYVVDREQLVAGHDARVREVELRQALRLRAGGQYDGVAAQGGAVVQGHRPGAGQPAAPRHHGDLARLQELGHTVPQPRRDGLLARHEGAEVQAHLAREHAVVGGGTRLVQAQRAGDHGLGGYAAAVQAGAADLARLHHRDLRAELGGPARGHVAGGPAAQHQDVTDGCPFGAPLDSTPAVAIHVVSSALRPVGASRRSPVSRPRRKAFHSIFSGSR